MLASTKVCPASRLRDAVHPDVWAAPKPTTPGTFLAGVADALGGLTSGRPETRLRQRRAALLRGQRIEKRLHRRARFARGHHCKIVMLLGERDEAEACGFRDRR